jgi:2-polyprenyl-3-methyl-5-hydroxy-6-metoxy-1,4-benzoquinol methylase
VAEWNHNAAYHPRIVALAGRVCGDVLDVGCGEGLLVQRLSPVSRSVLGIDRDERAVRHAASRTARLDNAVVRVGDFMTMDIGPSSFDLITMVASLHHMDLPGALRRAERLLRPGGEMLVVGLSANRTPGDYARSAVMLPVVRILSAMHRQTRQGRVLTIPPRHSLGQIRETTARCLPGSVVRRALYYRYILRWTKPAPAR